MTAAGEEQPEEDLTGAGDLALGGDDVFIFSGAVGDMIVGTAATATAPVTCWV